MYLHRLFIALISSIVIFINLFPWWKYKYIIINNSFCLFKKFVFKFNIQKI